MVLGCASPRIQKGLDRLGGLENQPTPKVLPARVWSQVLCAMPRWGHHVWLPRLREMGKDGLQARITALEEEVESVTDWQAIFSQCCNGREKDRLPQLEAVRQQETFL